jgi:hypothetical protein
LKAAKLIKQTPFDDQDIFIRWAHGRASIAMSF